MADQIEVSERVNKTYALMLTGRKTRDIVAYLTKTFSICEKTAYIYIKKAKELRDEDFAEYRQEALENQISLLRNLYDKNYKIQDFKECRAIVAELSALLGTKAAQKIEQDIKQTNTPPQININLVRANESKD